MRIGVFGAGAIGCYAGGLLAAEGHSVTLLGRERVLEKIQKNGLILESDRGSTISLEPNSIGCTQNPKDLWGCSLILFSVKGIDTRKSADTLKSFVDSKTVIVSLQNGIRNPKILKEVLPDSEILAAVVGFNVVETEDFHFRKTTDGELFLEESDSIRELQKSFERAGLRTQLRSDIESVQWGKLIFNLGNAVNALSGIPVREMLSDRGYRKVLAESMQEALNTLKKANIDVARFGRMVPFIAPTVLRLPNWLFFRVAAAMLSIDPKARSSMLEDLTKGRKTEIEDLNGEILRLAKSHNWKSPVNEILVGLIREAEKQKKGSPKISAEQLVRLLFGEPSRQS